MDDHTRDGAGVRCSGHEGPRGDARLTYARYARLPELLAQHRPLAGAAHHEHAFIAVHQVHELWFRLLLVELADARDRLLRGETDDPVRRFERCTAVAGMLFGALDVLDTMEPEDFAEFRAELGESSGAQSAQFFEIELLCGRRAASGVRHADWLTEEERTRIELRLAEPSVWEGLLYVLARRGYDIGTAEGRALGLSSDGVSALAAAMLAFAGAWSRWRDRHVEVAARQIGGAAGTGGTSGVAHLRARLGNRLFPELWEIGARVGVEWEGVRSCRG